MKLLRAVRCTLRVTALLLLSLSVCLFALTGMTVIRDGFLWAFVPGVVAVFTGLWGVRLIEYATRVEADL